MRTLLAGTLAAAALTLAMSVGTPVRADAADPSVHQIYEAAAAGHFDQAQQMMDQVLKDHPKSSKAHYVQAELFAREGKTGLARAELGQAEQLDPGLTHEKPESVQALKGQLGMLPRSTQSTHTMGVVPAPAASGFPWGTALVLLLVVGVLWMLFRRRSASQYPGGGPVMGAGGGAGYAGGPGGGYGPGGPVGGGMGSGIAGGLASGLAVGAGVVAGEELAHHFMDGRNGGTAVPPGADNAGWEQPSNGDMGGSDFGVNDGGGSWDDSSGGGGGGGDDWS